MEIGAEEAELAHLGDEFAGETALAEAVFNDGDEVVFDEGAGGVADHDFVFGEEGIELEEVYALELEGHFLTLSKHLRVADGGVGGEGLRAGGSDDLAWMNRVDGGVAMEIGMVQRKNVRNFMDLHQGCKTSVMNLDAADVVRYNKLTP